MESSPAASRYPEFLNLFQPSLPKLISFTDERQASIEPHAKEGSHL